jgi:hypothetical protein
MLGAVVMYNNKNSTLDCAIRNISETGARLVLSDSVTLPQEFDLHVPHRGRTYRARLRWRDADSVGVELFANEEAVAAAERDRAPPKPRMAQDIEAENAALRAEVHELRRMLEAAGVPVPAQARSAA